MAAHHLTLSAAGAVVVDPAHIAAEAAAGNAVPVVPNLAHRYGANEAARRAAYVDYKGEQKSIAINHDRHTKDVKSAFRILDDHCTPTGPATYHDFLPTEYSYGRFDLAWHAVISLINDMGGSARTALEMYQKLIMRHSESIADFRQRMFELEQIMMHDNFPIAGPIQDSTFETNLVLWENPNDRAHSRLSSSPRL